MEEYYFLFALGLVWVIFATVQDIRKREVANWLNFSLIAFALAYRLFYSVYGGDWMFFFYGLAGFGVFFVLAYAFYYGRVFAGGDAKLLMGIGAIVPFYELNEFISNSLGFLFLLFAFGAVYTLIYSVFIALKNKEIFSRSFKINLKRYRLWFLIPLFVVLVMMVFNTGSQNLGAELLLTGFAMVLLFVYIKSIDVCMIKEVSWQKLSEGDWLERDVKIGSRWIRRSVHGLSVKDIEMIRKYRKKVWIKEGVPFVPAFLIAFLVMVFVWVRLGNHWIDLVLSFFL